MVLWNHLRLYTSCWFEVYSSIWKRSRSMNQCSKLNQIIWRLFICWMMLLLTILKSHFFVYGLLLIQKAKEWGYSQNTVSTVCLFMRFWMEGGCRVFPFFILSKIWNCLHYRCDWHKRYDIYNAIWLYRLQKNEKKGLIKWYGCYRFGVCN